MSNEERKRKRAKTKKENFKHPAGLEPATSRLEVLRATIAPREPLDVIHVCNLIYIFFLI